MVQALFDDNGKPDNSMPWQIKAIGLIGVPSAIAIYLVLSLDQGIRADNRTLRESLNYHTQQTEVSRVQNEKILNTLESIKRSQDRTCANTAKTYADRSECFR